MSTKNITQSLLGADIEPVIFVHLAFNAGSTRIHSSIGRFTWGGNNWFGVGDLGSISMKEGVDLKPTTASLTLSTVNQSHMNEALNESTEGRLAEIYFGAIDDNGILNGTPDLLLAGTMGAPTVDMDTGLISIEIEDFRSRLFLINGKKFNLEDHQEDHPGDKFFEFLPKMLDHRFIFGGQNLGQNNIVGTFDVRDAQIQWWIDRRG